MLIKGSSFLFHCYGVSVLLEWLVKLYFSLGSLFHAVFAARFSLSPTPSICLFLLFECILCSRSNLELSSSENAGS